MKILIVTTPPNAVLAAVLNIDDADVRIVDCSANLVTIKTRVAESVHAFCPDIILTYRCPYIIPKSLYSIASKFALNIHPSLLPKYAGLNPWDEMFTAKEQIGGVTVHYLSEVPDGGDIIAQRAFNIDLSRPISVARNQADTIASKLIVSIIKSLP